MSWLDDATIEGKLVHAQIGQAIQTARLARALDEASTVTLGVLDPARELLGSNLWKQASRMHVEAHTYVLVRTERRANKFTLTFEDAIVYLLRQYQKHKVSRGNETWIDFLARLAKEAGVKVYCPEAATAIGLNHNVPNRGATPPSNVPRDAPSGTTGAFEAGTTPTVTAHGGTPPASGARPWTPASGEQQRSLTIALNVATDICQKLHLSPEYTNNVLVAMVAAGNGESGWHKASHNDVGAGHSGIFQQDPRYYSAPSDVAIATREFLVGGKTYNTPGPLFAFAGSMIALLKGFTGAKSSIGALIATRQAPGPVSKFAPYYDQYVAEARQTVSFWTGAPATSSTLPAAPAPATTTQRQWSRGTATSEESTWDCARRIASAFGFRTFIGPDGRLWIVTDQWLVNRASAAVLHSNVGAVETIEWTIDAGRKQPSNSAHKTQPMDTCTVNALDTWNVEPGSVVRLEGEGPADGRWLVSRWERDAVSPNSTITLAKPTEKLPPPTTTPPTTGTAPADPSAGGSSTPAAPRQFQVGTALVQPIPEGPWKAAVIGGIHETSGLPGYPAIDFGAIAGAPVVAVESGTIERFSGHDPRIGPVSGVHGPFGWTIYLRGQSGSDYFITHLGSRAVAVGQKVAAGQQIGTVGDYAKYGGANHTHIGVNPAPSGHPDINDLLGAPRATRS